MNENTLEKANKLKERIRCLEILEAELKPPFCMAIVSKFKHALFRLLIPSHIVRSRYYDILKEEMGISMSYEEEFANDILELVTTLLKKYRKQLEEL